MKLKMKLKMRSKVLEEEEGVTPKHEEVKEEVKNEEIDRKVDSHGDEFKAPSSYSLQIHLARGCPGQATVLLECGVFLQNSKTSLTLTITGNSRIVGAAQGKSELRSRLQSKRVMSIPPPKRLQ